MYSFIENVISQWDSGLYSARGVKFVVNFFLVFGSIEINPISRGTLKHSLPLIFCAFYMDCWFPLKFCTPYPPSNSILLLLQYFSTLFLATRFQTSKHHPSLAHNTKKHFQIGCQDYFVTFNLQHCCTIHQPTTQTNTTLH